MSKKLWSVTTAALSAGLLCFGCAYDVNSTERCSTERDCPNPQTQVCEAGTCTDKTPSDKPTSTHECETSKDCTDTTKPVCNAGSCIASTVVDPQQPKCKSDDDCTDAPNLVCSAGSCIAPTVVDPPKPKCESDADCTEATKPVCSAEGVCIASTVVDPQQPECKSDADCTEAPNLVCSEGFCVASTVVDPQQPECKSDADCTEAPNLVCSEGFCVASTVVDPEPGIKPEADILDVVFESDGSATNIAPTDLTVEKVGGTKLTISYSDTFKRNVAHFGNDIGETPDSYYRIDYSNNNDIQSKISDGHSLEAVIQLGTANNGKKEVKPFSSHQKGGTGFLLSKSSRDMAITFLPHVNGDYVWVSSGVVPQVGQYYHVVGVWDKSAGKGMIYVNGDLKNTVDASGEFDYSSEQWFAIGADPASWGAQMAWNGDIVLARVYSDPLTAKRVKELYKKSRVSFVTTP